MANPWKSPVASSDAPAIDLRKIMQEDSDHELAKKMTLSVMAQVPLEEIPWELRPLVAESLPSAADEIDPELLRQFAEEDRRAMFGEAPLLRASLGTEGSEGEEEEEEMAFDKALETAQYRSSGGEIITRQDLALSEARNADRLAYIHVQELGDPSGVDRISSYASNSLQRSLGKIGKK